jgi:hypothetical protein
MMTINDGERESLFTIIIEFKHQVVSSFILINIKLLANYIQRDQTALLLTRDTVDGRMVAPDYERGPPLCLLRPHTLDYCWKTRHLSTYKK